MQVLCDFSSGCYGSKDFGMAACHVKMLPAETLILAIFLVTNELPMRRKMRCPWRAEVTQHLTSRGNLGDARTLRIALLCPADVCVTFPLLLSTAKTWQAFVMQTRPRHRG